MLWRGRQDLNPRPPGQVVCGSPKVFAQLLQLAQKTRGVGT